MAQALKTMLFSFSLKMSKPPGKDRGHRPGQRRSGPPEPQAPPGRRGGGPRAGEARPQRPGRHLRGALPSARPPPAPPRGDHTRVWRTTHLRRDPARVRPLVRTLRVCDPAVSACGLVFSRVSSKSPLFPAESSPQGTSDTPETTREVYFTVQLFSLESLLLTKQSKRLVPQNPSWVCRARDHSARRADTPGPEEPAP